jgi:hypothetical protein
MAPVDFERCQLCGHRSDSPREFHLWIECSEDDFPEYDRAIILCEACGKMEAETAERLYLRMPWGEGAPGTYLYVCGDCLHRQQFECAHPYRHGEKDRVTNPDLIPRVRVDSQGSRLFVDGGPGENGHHEYVGSSPVIRCSGYGGPRSEEITDFSDATVNEPDRWSLIPWEPPEGQE